MPDLNFNYDHPNYTVIRTHCVSITNTTAGTQADTAFRSSVKAVVTKIGVVLSSVSSVTLNCTLLHNGSIAAILTLSNSANEVAREFTLAVNRTLDTILDRFEISTAKDKGKFVVIYEYRIAPMSSFDLNAAIT
jgi:hypothetical protein